MWGGGHPSSIPSTGTSTILLAFPSSGAPHGHQVSALPLRKGRSHSSHPTALPWDAAPEWSDFQVRKLQRFYISLKS